MKHPLRIVLAAILCALLPLAAQAHPGHEVHGSFALGLMHPLTGWDHFLLLLCMGLLVAGRGARIAWGGGALLAAALAGGAAIGLWFPQAAFVEQAVLATVLVSASLLLFRVRVGSTALLAMCLGFTLVHGVAHGQEAPAGSVPAFFAGFTLAGLALYACGVVLAPLATRLPRAWRAAPSA